MNISRKSWHYKINKMGETSESRTLCGYFWRCVFHIFMLVFCSFVVGILILAYFYCTDPIAAAMNIMVAFVVSSIVLPIVVIRYIRKRLDGSPEMPYGNVVIEVMKAQKRRICPLIEYTWD